MESGIVATRSYKVDRVRLVLPTFLDYGSVMAEAKHCQGATLSPLLGTRDSCILVC